MYPNYGDYQGRSYQQGLTNNNYGDHPFGMGYNNQPYPNQEFQNQGFGYNQSKKTFGNFTIPDEFQMDEKVLTFGMDMYLYKDGQKIGFMNEKIFEKGSTFQLQDNQGNVIATARQKVLSYGRDFEIFDQNLSSVGFIKQELFELSSKIKYTIFDRNKNVVALSSQLEISKNSSIQVQLPESLNLQAKFFEKDSTFIKDKWTIRFFGENVDRRLLIFFPVISSNRQLQETLEAIHQAQQHRLHRQHIQHHRQHHND